MKSKLSIIITAYNLEEYIERCLNSIIKQKESNYEIIIVDDGSRDNTSVICNRIASCNKNIFLKCKKNEGLSVARNYGINCSTGTHIFFLDGDDYLPDGTIKRVLNEINDNNDCDIFIGESYSVYEDKIVGIKNKRKSCSQKNITGADYLRNIRRFTKNISFCAQFMIYKKKFIQENNLSFYPGILHEDELWTPQVLLLSKKIRLLDYPIYCHCIRSNSIMHSNNYHQRAHDIIIINNRLKRIYKKFPNDITSYLRARTVQNFLNMLNYIPVNDRYVLWLSKKYLLRNSKTAKTFLKSVIFCFSKRIYFFAKCR